jgi:hypothetical protein
MFWKLRPGVDKSTRELKVDWNHLQRPGFSPDYLQRNSDLRMDLDFERSDWIPTAAAESLLKYNMPLLAWIAGRHEVFTSKDHNFQAGDSFEKQLIVINDSRAGVTCDCQWSLDLPQPLTGSRQITVAPGQQERIPMQFQLPPALPARAYNLNATVHFSNGRTQNDTLVIDTMAAPAPPRAGGKIALFDPKGETGAWLARLGIATQPVTADSDLSGYDTLIVGKAALSPDAGAPDISRVKDGLKVLMFEQTSETLEKRFGLRVEEYGLRQVFARLPAHPALAGLDANNLCNWRGEATLTPPRFKYETKSGYGPIIHWCGIPEPHVWRCGNRGNVASVLIEKPACGDFLPVLDGGFSLQFSPLMEYREGKGLVMFCQMDVTGRTETDPAADKLARNLLNFVSAWKPAPRRNAAYAGTAAGKGQLESMGIKASAYDGGKLPPGQVLVLGSGAAATLAGHTAAVADWVKAGGNVLAVGLTQEDASALFPFRVTIKKAGHISCGFEARSLTPLLAGVCPADLQNHAPCEMPLVTAGAQILGDGVLAQAQKANVVFFQMEPWQFASTNQANLRRTFRRASFALSRLLANMGVSAPTPLLERFHQPPTPGQTEKRWLTGFYLDQPQEWDDPYRFFRW